MHSFLPSDLGERCRDVVETDLVGRYFESEAGGVFDVIEHPEGVRADVFEGDQRNLAVLYAR